MSSYPATCRQAGLEEVQGDADNSVCPVGNPTPTLGVCGEEHDETVLIVDLDPQHSATLWHSARGTDKPTVIDAIPEKLTNIV